MTKTPNLTTGEITDKSKKRTNPVAKGRRNEKRTEAHFKAQGYIVETTKRSSYRGGSNDFFGLWDHIAVSPNGRVTFIQTKSNRKPPKKAIEAMRSFPWLPFCTFRVIFVWHDRQKEPEIIHL